MENTKSVKAKDKKSSVSKKDKSNKNTKTNSKEKSKSKPKTKVKVKKSVPKSDLKIIPLGGLCEIGKNMTAFEYEGDMIIVDVGMSFPQENMPGVDCVIQDYTYVRENAHKLRGIILTHGHEDHIGALPYFLKEFQCPIYGGTLTVQLVHRKLTDSNIPMAGISFKACKNGDKVRLGRNFEVEFVRVNHSIADSYAVSIKTPVGIVVHSGDFKIDYTPINGKPIDLQRFGEIGKEGVLLFMCESTNIEIDGFSPSERHVGESFKQLFEAAEGRIIVATFSSHVHRMQQIFTAAEKYGKHVCLSGRSMITVFNVANSLGYIEMNPDTLIDIEDIDKYDDDKVVILTTGSQAEPMSALTRMAYASHKSVMIRQGDTVIISADPIPGNEKSIYNVINELYKLGAKVIYQSLAEVHVSGHAYKSEIMMLHSLLKPKYMVPVHGEYRMLFHHKKLAESMGMPSENVFILDNGDVLSVNPYGAKITNHVPAGAILIDGSDAADINNRVLLDRRLLSEDGCLAVAITVDDSTGNLAARPIVNSIGFVFEDEKTAVQNQLEKKIEEIIFSGSQKYKSYDEMAEKRAFKENIRNACYSLTKRKPLVLVTVSHIRTY